MASVNVGRVRAAMADSQKSQSLRPRRVANRTQAKPGCLPLGHGARDLPKSILIAAKFPKEGKAVEVCLETAATREPEIFALAPVLPGEPQRKRCRQSRHISARTTAEPSSRVPGKNHRAALRSTLRFLHVAGALWASAA